MGNPSEDWSGDSAVVLGLADRAGGMLERRGSMNLARGVLHVPTIPQGEEACVHAYAHICAPKPAQREPHMPHMLAHRSPVAPSGSP